MDERRRGRRGAGGRRRRQRGEICRRRGGGREGVLLKSPRLPQVEACRRHDSPRHCHHPRAPEFVPLSMAEETWKALCELPTADSESPLSPFDPSASPSWVSGDSPEIKYRGWTLKRDKIWFQRSVHPHSVAIRIHGMAVGGSSGTFLLLSSVALTCRKDRRSRRRLRHLRRRNHLRPASIRSSLK